MPEYDLSARLTTGELIACTAAMAATTATAGVYSGVPATTAAAVGAAAATSQAIYNARKGGTLSALATRTASWLVAAGWTTWHLAAHAVPDTTGWTTAACAAILAVAANWTINRTEPDRQHERALLSFKRQAVRTMDEWDDRLERVTRITGCKILPNIKPWPLDAGYTLEVQLPHGGTSWKELAAYAEALASDMRLPDGCGVEVAKGADRGRALIRVSTRDMISETVMYAEDWTELDFNDGFTFGFHRDGSDALASLLDDCGIVVGDTGSGKTNLVNTIIAALARMPNVLIWAIDTTGAGVALPWITPWALVEDGRTDQACAPAVDWVAHTQAEAKLMLRFAIMIIALRKARYQKLMRAHNTDKIPVSPQVPAIVILADETAELPGELQKLIDSVMNTGRAVRVRSLNSALRSTQDTITAAMKKRSKLRIGLHTEDPEELSYTFSGYQVLDMADAPVPGSGFYTYGKGGPRPFKARRLEPDGITRCTIACGDRRPALDPVSAEAPLYAHYEGRWARALPALYPDEKRFSEAVETYLRELAERGVDPAVTGDEGATEPAVEAAMKAELPDPGADTGAITPDALDRMFAAAGTSRPIPVPTAPAAPAAPGPQRPQAGAGDGFDRVIHQTGETPPTGRVLTLLPSPTAVTATPKALAYRLLHEAGPGGTGAKTISETIDAPRTTVQRWLKEWTDTGKATQRGEGSHVRYIHPAHATGQGADTDA